jgi:hypothetical protein
MDGENCWYRSKDAPSSAVLDVVVGEGSLCCGILGHECQLGRAWRGSRGRFVYPAVVC